MRILIELPTWLGDSIMATPAIENIFNQFEKSEVTFIGSKISVEALKNHPKVTESIELNKNFISLYKFSKNSGRYDVFFSFRGSYRSKFLKFFIKSKSKYQYQHKKYVEKHQVEKYTDFINESLETNMLAGPLNLHKNLKSVIYKKKLLGINPGASYGSAKRWYPEEFAKVALELSDKFDIYIFGGPNEKDIAGEIEFFLTQFNVKNFKNLAGLTSVKELIEKISILDLFITGDSGPMHVAACFNIPTISIFGPTKDYETSQWMNDQSINIKKDLSCQPCMKRVCPLGHHNCMKEIKAKDVLIAAKNIK
jgi:heptosyltransferase II